MKFAACPHLLLAFVPATVGFTAVSKRRQSHVNTLMASPDDVETGISRRYFASSIGAFAVGSFALSREASGFDDSSKWPLLECKSNSRASSTHLGLMHIDLCSSDIGRGDQDSGFFASFL